MPGFVKLTSYIHKNARIADPHSTILWVLKLVFPNAEEVSWLPSENFSLHFSDSVRNDEGILCRLYHNLRSESRHRFKNSPTHHDFEEKAYYLSSYEIEVRRLGIFVYHNDPGSTFVSLALSLAHILVPQVTNGSQDEFPCS